MRQILLALFLLVPLFGCSEEEPTGPPSVQEKSFDKEPLNHKIAFVEHYVSFRRKYLALEYDIAYHDNSSGVPGPADWDIRLLAQVPTGELTLWQPPKLSPVKQALPKWVQTMPGKIPQAGLSEWYLERGLEVGLDRKAGIVAYRSFTQ